MLSYAKKWWAAFKRPSDPIFKRRPQAKQCFGNWLLVELGATEYVILMDTLHAIHNSDADIEVKGREILGLRYQALAMSVRTKTGKIPLDWRSETDLMWLAKLPYSETAEALKQISQLSDISWLNPVQEPTVDEDAKSEIVSVTSDEIAVNPS